MWTASKKESCSLHRHRQLVCLRGREHAGRCSSHRGQKYCFISSTKNGIQVQCTNQALGVSEPESAGAGHGEKAELGVIHLQEGRRGEAFRCSRLLQAPGSAGQSSGGRAGLSLLTPCSPTPDQTEQETRDPKPKSTYSGNGEFLVGSGVIPE